MKKYKLLIVLVLVLVTLTGCIKRDKMDAIEIKTTVYPIEYLIDNIYGYNSNISSIYPNDTVPKEYKITDKKLKEYSKVNMFVYNGLTSEKQIAATLLNENNKLKLIDVSQGLSITHDVEELWLSPSNYLMLAQNVKNALVDYANSTILKQEIEKKYDDLKLIISQFDANFKTTADKSNNKNIIAGNDVFKFLEKYGFTVLSIEENDTYDAKEYQKAKNLITQKKNKYIYLLDTEKGKESENVKKLMSAGAQVIYINSIETLTDEERANKVTYQTVMNEFIDNIKKETYNS